MRLLKSGAIPENVIQKTVMQWVRCQPQIGNYIIHIPNEGKRSLRYGKSLKDLGMLPGVADLFIAIPKHNYHGAWIEIKSAKGKISPVQKEFLSHMSMHYFTKVTYSIDETIDIISWYCF